MATNRPRLFPNIEFRYCLLHGREVIVETDEQGRQFHLLNREQDGNEVNPLSSLDVMSCYGTFAYAPPPPTLDDLEWELIFEKEGEFYGTEGI